MHFYTLLTSKVNSPIPGSVLLLASHNSRPLVLVENRAKLPSAVNAPHVFPQFCTLALCPLMTPLTRGYLIGFIGVAIFSLTLPFTRIAVMELNPLFVSIGRTVIAGFTAIPILLLTRQPWPSRSQLGQMLIIAAGAIFGFPIFSALAMQTVPASHGGVVLGALPLATGITSMIFAGERPSPAFWLWSIAGSAAVIVFALGDGATSLEHGDGLLLLALISASTAYAVSGKLSRTLGGWQTICWALVLVLPITLPITLVLFPANLFSVSASSLGSFLYLSLMSQLVGFFAWNKGLATGGVARVGQVQLLQTFLTLLAATVINSEPLTLRAVGFAVVVAMCVWFGRKAHVG